MNGKNIVEGAYVEINDGSLKAVNPATGLMLEGEFDKANETLVNKALQSATKAFKSYRHLNKDLKADFLNAIADEITSIGEELVTRASAESGLPLGRLQGELGRTTGQLRLFANLVAEGSWVDAIIDTAIPERQPLPRPDIRRMLVPIGLVVVFGASNFPLAFSVAGGDTASALASGCPVIVKAHPAHYGTSALVGEAIIKAAEKTGMPKGVFSLLYDDGYTIGTALVQHPLTKAVTFTGSFKGGMALIHLAQQREHPIPVFAEMGSINPVIFLPEIIENQAEELAKKYAASITLGAGQFCTNPGLLLAVQSPALDSFITFLREAIAKIPSATMLTEGIAHNYNQLSTEIVNEDGVALLSASNLKNDELQNQSQAKIAQVSASHFINNPKLREEIFGPYSLLVVARDISELEQAVDVLEGQLTITIMAEKQELQNHRNLIDKLTDKTGRIIFNGVPTGVEVCAAMQHGGPFPATNDSRFTSVGSTAIHRFARPLAYQDWEEELLPDELKDGNPLGIFRTVNQK
ncbi:aldehyde dehydrogenase (NADP(+)) [Chryseobacterium sp. L7]|uniref:Aldehyde dehydrogenase (NADP(+)) n=1 Tax=Chryseobacterium endalhagicum TaxID=2797638 RepID=A0ABS1QLC5_9FLAO|nr:aldehyde dehydrogenase (NADP(+)) [Chryseobacterium endalhagicum]MBL1223428.1 aldehyde dehydrogenase (NADP(+)) [Chryseobacterium endalhagicum]